jgi:CheY-like chemotaxis protein
MNPVKVLLVEDEIRILTTLEYILQRNGYEVVTAGNGLEALDVVKSFTPDMILCDVMMPKMDGYDFLRQYRSTVNASTPFIFLTAKSDYSDIRSGMALGADDYLVKPVRSEELIHAITTRLNRTEQINDAVLREITRLEKGMSLLTNHEFNTPMTAIVGFLSLIKASFDKIDKETLRQYLDYIQDATERLQRLMSKIRWWQQLEEKNSYETGKTQVKAQLLVEKVVKGVAEKYKRPEDLIVSLSPDISLLMHEELLDILVHELADNAFKFTRKGESVVISVRAHANQMEMIVADYGNKSTAAELAQYQPFVQFNRKQFEQQGLGIGLQLIKLIVQQLQGDIQILDNEPIGIKIIITIPLNQ